MADQEWNYDGLGRIGYEAYAKKTGGLTFDERKMPEWDALPQNIKDAWAAASEGIHDAIARATVA